MASRVSYDNPNQTKGKQRPIRLYIDPKTDRIYFYRKGKKTVLNIGTSNLTTAQKRVMTKIHGNLIPTGRITKSDRVVSKIRPHGPPLKHISEIRPLNETDVGLKYQEQLLTDAERAKRLLGKIEHKAATGAQISEEDKNAAVILLEKNRVDEEKNRIDEEKKRAEEERLAKEAKKLEKEQKNADRAELLLRQSLTKDEIRDEIDAAMADLWDGKPAPRVLPTIKVAPKARDKSRLEKNQRKREEKFVEEVKKRGFEAKDMLEAFQHWNGLTEGTQLIASTPVRILDTLLEMPSRLLYDAFSDPKWQVNNYDSSFKVIIKAMHQMTPRNYWDLVLAGKFPKIIGFNDAWPPEMAGRGKNIPADLAHHNKTEPQYQQIGEGVNLPALYDDEINEFFSDDKEYPNFGGVIAADEINKLPKKLPIGFIMNLDKSDQPGSHWVAVYINGDSVEYFDPLANPPSSETIKQIKKFLTSMKVPILMKFKVNKIKQQHGNSHRCGYHSIRFLDDRFHNTPFPLTTRFSANNLRKTKNQNGDGIYDDSKKGEKIIRDEFGYI